MEVPVRSPYVFSHGVFTSSMPGRTGGMVDQNRPESFSPSSHLLSLGQCSPGLYLSGFPHQGLGGNQRVDDPTFHLRQVWGRIPADRPNPSGRGVKRSHPLAGKVYEKINKKPESQQLFLKPSFPSCFPHLAWFLSQMKTDRKRRVKIFLTCVFY